MKSGWQYIRLGELCTIARGGSPRPISQYITNDENGINWIKIGDTERGGRYIDQTQEKIRPEGAARSRFVEPGSFLLSNSMSFGRPYILRTSGCIHDGWLVLDPDYNRVDQDFLYYVLSSRVVYDQFDRLAAGSTVRNLNIGLAEVVEFPLPPLKEQQQIVAILDEAFEGLDRARANAEANLQNARDLFQHMTTMRINSEEFPTVPLSEICDVRDGTHNTPNYVKNGVPLVTQKNIRPEGLNLENVKLISRSDHLAIHKRSNVAKGDILISMIGANRGMSCLVDSEDVFSIKNVGLIKATDKMNMDFLLFYLQSAAAEKYVAEATNGGAQPFIGLGKLRAFPTPVPERRLQEKIASEIFGMTETAAVLKMRYQLMLQDLTELRQSILQKAFAGQLT
ncbi:MAG: type I restriction endonuclease subunit S [Rhizobium sp.]|nr:MAG: type I restriction endonuclease subunit S [Rhizobium sp.]